LAEETTFHYRGKSLKPIIPLVIKRGDKETRLDAVIDSGADMGIFDASVAEKIGLPFSMFEQKKIAEIHGKVTAHICKIEVRVLEEFFEMPVAFVPNYTGPFNILGRKGFFERHIITFDEAKLEIKISKASIS